MEYNAICVMHIADMWDREECVADCRRRSHGGDNAIAIFQRWIFKVSGVMLLN